MQKVIWVLLAFALVLFVLLYREGASSDLEGDAKNINSTLVASECKITDDVCSIALPYNGIVVEITSSLEAIRALEPVEILIRFRESSPPLDKHLWPEELSLHFAGREMEMGSHYMLPKSKSGKDDGLQIFQGMIPVCSVDPAMAWNLVTSFKLNDKRYVIHNRLKTSTEH